MGRYGSIFCVEFANWPSKSKRWMSASV
jgi:hypothetical protein